VITRKSAREIDQMRRAGRIVAEVLALVESELKPGVTTGHLDELAERHIRNARAIP
jgi:methionyl aminopeptidase